MVETKFSSRFNANYNRSKRLQSAVLNIFDNACRFYWLSEFINKAFGDLRAEDDYKRLPQKEQQWIEGHIAFARKQIDRLTTHAYLCNDGKFRVNIDGYEKYKYPSEKSVKTIVENTCTLVWKNKPEMVYFFGDTTEKTLVACKTKFVRQNESIVELSPIPLAKKS